MEEKLQNMPKMELTKTESKLNITNFILMTITKVFIIIATLILIFGFCVYFRHHSFMFLIDSAKNGRFFTPSIISILVGIALMTLLCFGFCGSVRQNICMLNVYAVILSVFLITKLIAVCLLFILNESTIAQFIDMPVSEYATDPEIRAEMEMLQYTLRCCGENSFEDYKTIDFRTQTSLSTIPLNEEVFHESYEVPLSCCSKVNANCVELNDVGCKSALIDTLKNSIYFGVFIVFVMCVELLGIIYTILLARRIRKLKSERSGMIWTIQEPMILSREAIEKKPLLNSHYSESKDFLLEKY